MEADDLYPAVKDVVQEEQLKKKLEEKQTKKIGWFSYGKKELKEDEIHDIEKFIEDNFSEELTIYTRPMAFAYVETTVFLNEANIYVGKKEKGCFEGVLLKLVDLELTLSKREKGMDVKLNLTDLTIDLVENNYL